MPIPRMRIPRPGRVQITGIRSAQNSPLARAMATVLCFALTGWAVVGCDGKSAASGDGSAPPPAVTFTPTPSPSPTQADFTHVVGGDCLTGQSPRAEISCDDSKADAKVVGAGIGNAIMGAHSAQTSCPADTDVIFNEPDGGGYLCLRKLHPPHLARPGLGGGVVVVGDCLIKHGYNSYVETPCDGSWDRPEYKVLDVRKYKEGRCPKGRGRVQFSADTLGLKNYCAKKL